MLLFLLSVCVICASPGYGNTGRKFHNALIQQNFQSILLSIEDKLRNIYTAQYSTNFEGKLEQNSRKLDALEAKLNRLEAIIGMQFDKIAENMSNGHFKEEISRDHVIRKIDSVYERINHKLVYLEMKMEMGEKKILDKLDIMYNRFEKMEDTLTTREADIEVEIADVLSVVDDIKSTCSNIDISNITKQINRTVNSIEMVVRNNLKQLNQKVEKETALLEEHIVANFNETADEIFVQGEELRKGLNENINKVLDLYDSSMKKIEIQETILKTIGAILNTTRNEQQNGLRNLVVQVGRLGGKNNNLSDGNVENVQLTTLGEKLDANFENIMVLQNLFLESCHRIQMDETQLESKISEVLEKLIDTFERKTSIELKDLKSLENMIKVHDATIRRNIYTNSHNFGILLQKGKDNNDELKGQITHVKIQIEGLFGALEELKKHNKNDQINAIMDCLKKLEIELQQTSQKTDRGNLMETVTQSLIDQMWKAIADISTNTTQANKVHLYHVLNIGNTLKNITSKLATIETTPNDILIKKIEELLTKHLAKNTTSTQDLDEVIRKVFGINPELLPITYIDEEEVCNEFGIDVRNGFKKCKNKTDSIIFKNVNYLNCTDYRIDVRNGINITTCKDNIVFQETEKENCNDFNIDIRSGAKTCKNKTTNIKTEANCTNFDIRSGIKTCVNNTDQIHFEEDFNINCTNFEIDVRTGSKKCKIILNPDQIQYEDVDDSNCTDFDIDVRTGFKKCKEIKTDTTHIKSNKTSLNCTDFNIDIRTGFKICNQSTDELQFEDVNDINCTDFDIDVRTGFKKCKEITDITPIKFEETSINCKDFDIDVRTGFKKCKQSTDEIQFEDVNINCTDFDIDVRTGFKKCKQSTDEIQFEDVNINCTYFDIDEQTGFKTCREFEDVNNVNCTDFDIDVRTGFKQCKEPKMLKPCSDYDIDISSGAKICNTANQNNKVELNCTDSEIDDTTGTKNCKLLINEENTTASDDDDIVNIQMDFVNFNDIDEEIDTANVEITTEQD